MPSDRSSASDSKRPEVGCAVAEPPNAGGPARCLAPRDEDSMPRHLAEVPHIASGLSHDLGNVLMPIRLALESLAKSDLPPRLRADLESIRCSADYLQNLAAGLRMLSRDPRQPSPEGPRTDLRGWWREIDPLVRALLRGRVAVAEFSSEKPLLVQIPRHRLTHAVFALLRHVIDIHLSASQKVELSVDPVLHSPRVRVCISEKRLEEWAAAGKPSTADGAGVLVWVRELLEEVGGLLEVDAHPGSGTVLTLSIPMTDPLAASSGGDAKPLYSAFLNLPQTREGAYVRSVMEALGARVFDKSAPPPPELLTLWITSDMEDALAAAGQGGPRRAKQVMYFGDGLTAAPDNVVILGPRPEPPLVRDALKRALHVDCSFQSVLP